MAQFESERESAEGAKAQGDGKEAFQPQRTYWRSPKSNSEKTTRHMQNVFAISTVSTVSFGICKQCVFQLFQQVRNIFSFSVNDRLIEN